MSDPAEAFASSASSWPGTPAAMEDHAQAQWPGTPAQTGATQWPGTPLHSTTPQSTEPTFLQSLGAGLGEAVTHPINFLGEAAGVLSPSSVEAGLGAVGAAIRPDLVAGAQGNDIRNQAAAEVFNSLPAAVRPVVAGTANAVLPQAALLSRAISGQEQGKGLEGLNAALQQGFAQTNPGTVGKVADIATSVAANIPFLANPAVAPVAMAAQGAEAGIAQNEQNPNQSVGADLLNVGGQAALNYLFGKLLPGQKLNDALLQKFAPELVKASEGAIKRTLLQAGVQGAEGYAFQLAMNSVRKLAGQEVPLTEGTGTNALVQGLTGGILHGLNEATRPAGPAPKVPTAAEVPVPEVLQKMVVKSREGENKGQPMSFASPVEKAQHIVNRPDFRGPVVEQSKQYLEQVGKVQAQQTPPSENLAPPAPAPQPAVTEVPVQKVVEKPTMGSKAPTPNDEVFNVAMEYAKSEKLPESHDTTYVKVDEARAKRIADWYDKAQSEPNDPKVQASYNALKQETRKQYDTIVKAGYKLEPYLGEGQAYKSSAEMMKDVRENKHLFYDPTDKTGFGSTNNAGNPHPMMEDTGLKIDGKEVPYNDLFRAVHDFFGHAKQGVGFGPRGEENAWRQHMQMYSPEARPAMTTETRGQNSWVNFGPKGEANRTNPGETTFAEQKAVLPPDWVVNEGAVSSKAFTPAKVTPKTEALPKELAGAKPRYGLGNKLFDLNFSSDVDKALYIMAKNTKSKQHDAYVRFAEEKTGLKGEELNAKAQEVKARIKELAKAAPKDAESLDVPHGVDLALSSAKERPPTEYGYWVDKEGTYHEVPFQEHDTTAEKLKLGDSTTQALSNGNVRIIEEPKAKDFNVEVAAGQTENLKRVSDFVLEQLKDGKTGYINNGEYTTVINPAEIGTGKAMRIFNNIAEGKARDEIITSQDEARSAGRSAHPEIRYTYPKNAEQGQLQQAMRALGKQIIWFEGGAKGAKGFTVQGIGDTIYLDRSVTGAKLNEYLAHELFHTVQYEHPELAQQAEKLFSPAEHQAQVEEYYSRAVGLGRTDIVREMESSPAKRARESGAMLVGQVARNPEVLKGLTEGQRTWVQKAIDAILQFMGKKPKLTPIEQKLRVQFEQIHEALKSANTAPSEAGAVSYALPPRPLSPRAETPEGRAAYAAEDQRRKEAGLPETKPDVKTEGEADAIVKRGDPALHELINKGNSGQSFTDSETVAVRKFVDQQLPTAIQDKNINRIGLLGELISADRNAGTEQGRAFRQRRAVTPQERLRNTLAEAIAVPPAAEGKTPSKGEKIDHLKAIKKYMKENGILDQMTPANMADPVWVSQRLNDLSTINPKANKIYEYFLASVLSGPQTQERNLLGNITNFGINQVVNRPLEMAINAFVKDPNAAQFGEWKYIFKDMGPRIQQAWTNAIQSFRAERPIFNGRIMDLHPELTGPAIEGTKGKIIRTPLRLLTAVDQFMKTIVGVGEVGARAFREGKAKGLVPKSPEMESYVKSQMDNQDSQAWKDAYNYAKDVAFQGESGPITKALINLRESVKLPGTDIHPLRYMVLGPFLRIAGKLEGELWKYTPFGSLAVAGRGLAGRYKGNAPRAIQDVAKQIVAWGTFAALWGATGDDKNEPWITGSVTREAKDLAYRTAPPMSIRLPGYGWVSYKHLQPISGAITTMIDALEGMKGMERGQSFNDAVGGFVAKVKDRVQNQTFLQSLGDFLDAMDSPDKATAFLSNFGASWVPNLVRQPLNQGQATVKESKTLADTSPFEQLARRSLPGVFSALPRVTPWGAEVTKPGTALERMLNPFTRFSGEVHPADAVIAKYNLQNPDTPYYVNVPSPTLKVDDKFQKMTEQEYYDYLRLSGLLADKAVRNIPRVRDGTADAHAIDQIQKARTRALDQAGGQFKAALHYKNKGQQDRYDAILKRVEDTISRLEK